MEEKNVKIQSSKILLNEQFNDMFIEMDIAILNAEPNLNKYFFQESFIDQIIENKQDYIGTPLVADYERLMDKDFYQLGHQFSPFIGKFFTQEIGSFVDFTKTYDENNIAQLIGTARVSKRNADLVDAILELNESDVGLSFSVEVKASDYSFDSNQNLLIGASPNNHIIGVATVSFPAYQGGKALRLVAELNESIKKSVLGGEKVADKKDILSELSHTDIRSQLNELLNPNRDSEGWRIYDYWIVSVFNDYCVVSDEHKSGVYYKFTYTVNDKDEVTLGEKSQVTIQFVSINNKGGHNMDNVNIDVNELVKAKEELLLENEKLTKQVESLTAQVKEVETSLNEANETVVSLGKEKETLTAEVEDLRTYKAEIVEKETTVKINSIIDEVKAELTEDELKLINEVVETKDVEKVQFKVNEIMAKKYKETLKLTNSQKEENYFPTVKAKTVVGEDDLSKFNM